MLIKKSKSSNSARKHFELLRDICFYTGLVASTQHQVAELSRSHDKIRKRTKTVGSLGEICMMVCAILLSSKQCVIHESGV